MRYTDLFCPTTNTLQKKDKNELRSIIFTTSFCLYHMRSRRKKKLDFTRASVNEEQKKKNEKEINREKIVYMCDISKFEHLVCTVDIFSISNINDKR